MHSRLDYLLLETVRPSNLSVENYLSDLRRPIGSIESTVKVGAHHEVLRIVRGWPDLDSPVSRCRVLCLLRHFKNSLRFAENSLGSNMLSLVEGTIPPRVAYIARLHELGFSSFIIAHDLYEQTLRAFQREKGVDLDLENKTRALQSYLLAVYHLGRSRMVPGQHREVILFGAHDSFVNFYCRPMGIAPVAPESFVVAYESVVRQWVDSASANLRQSPAHAFVKTVFNQLGLTSPVDRMACASLLEASASHLLELSETVQQPTSAYRH